MWNWLIPFLTWSENCFIEDAPITDQAPAFTITEILYVLVVTLSTQDNTKLLQQSKSGLKRTINWNKHQSKVTVQEIKQYVDYLTDPRFQGVFTLCFIVWK